MAALDLQDHPHVHVNEPSTETGPTSAPPSEEEAFLQAVRTLYADFDEVHAFRDGPLRFDIYIFIEDHTVEDHDKATDAKMQLWDLFPNVEFSTHVWAHQGRPVCDIIPTSDIRLV